MKNGIKTSLEESKKPLALDLCAGLGGWTLGLLAADWDVIGIDIEARNGYPEKAYFIKSDVREFLKYMKKEDWENIALVVASPPCQEFSYRSFPFKRCRELAATTPPDESIWLACEQIARKCNAPLILENVRGAQKYMGKAKTHYGSFYLWGDVPALLPIGRPIKGFVPDENVIKRKFPGEMERKKRGWSGMQMAQHNSHSKKRKEFSANAAMIPFELAYWVGQCFYPRKEKS